jgi:tRNA (guanosine-2'-O-)-methyltransferase
MTGPSSRQGARKKRPRDISGERRHRRPTCNGHLVAAALFVAYEANLGTLLRTCDAVGACLAVSRSPGAKQALRRGNTLRHGGCVHWVGRGPSWLARQRERGARIVGVELADDAVRLADLAPARERTIVVLGHEHHGIPEELWDLLDEVVEIPMVGTGASLNVAVAGSLVLYKLGGLL